MRTYFVLFFGGLVWDAMIALNVAYVAGRDVLGVFVTAFALTYIAVAMYRRVLFAAPNTRLKVFVFAVASALGMAGTTAYFDAVQAWLRS